MVSFQMQTLCLYLVLEKAQNCQLLMIIVKVQTLDDLVAVAATLKVCLCMLFCMCMSDIVHSVFV